MEILRIAVVSPDEAYNRAFSVSLLDACRQISVTTYTTRQFVMKWGEYEGPGAFYDRFDLILWADEQIRDAYGDNIIYLTERTSLVDMDYDRNRFALYKYSRADAVVAAVFDVYAHLTGREAALVKRNDVRLFAFASYCGGAGCTTMARAVGQDLSRFRGKRVMLLTLEEVESAADFMPLHEGVKSEGEFLYRLLGKGSTPFLESYLVRDLFGVYSFAPPAGKNPMRDLTGPDMERLIAALMERGAFDVILADLSTSLGEGAMAVIGAADRLCIVAQSDEPGARERHFTNQIEDICGERVRSRRTRIRMENGWLGPDPVAPLEGKFGEAVSNLTEVLLDVLK